AAGLAELGLPAGTPSEKRLLYGCVDWSERRDHFAGPLAVSMLNAFVARGWLRRHADSRVLDVTPAGQAGLVASLLAPS
ncbi:MAG: transcriptional regulator, partial [Burkholderiales bacterium]